MNISVASLLFLLLASLSILVIIFVFLVPLLLSWMIVGRRIVWLAFLVVAVGF